MMFGALCFLAELDVQHPAQHCSYSSFWAQQLLLIEYFQPTWTGLLGGNWGRLVWLTLVLAAHLQCTRDFHSCDLSVLRPHAMALCLFGECRRVSDKDAAILPLFCTMCIWMVHSAKVPAQSAVSSFCLLLIITPLAVVEWFGICSTACSAQLEAWVCPLWVLMLDA